MPADVGFANPSYTDGPRGFDPTEFEEISNSSFVGGAKYWAASVVREKAV
jgi:hypothetical protein